MNPSKASYVSKGFTSAETQFYYSNSRFHSIRYIYQTDSIRPRNFPRKTSYDSACSRSCVVGDFRKVADGLCDVEKRTKRVGKRETA